MRVERIRGRDLPAMLRRVREVLGEEAMILGSRTTVSGDLELLALPALDAEALRRQLHGVPARATADLADRIRPEVIALVGPGGVGKTTALMKLALQLPGFGRRKVGLLTLDTYRVGGLAEIRAYADVARLPLEVAYDAGEASGALRRLRECEVVLVDTPGRLDPLEGGLPDWIEILRALECDEVHLVLPAGSRLELVRNVRWRFHPCSPTHFLMSRLDEGPWDGSLLEVARAAALPARWVSSGADVSDGLAPAYAGILDQAVGRLSQPLRPRRGGGGGERAAG